MAGLDMEEIEKGITIQGEDGQLHYVVLEVRLRSALILGTRHLLILSRHQTTFASSGETAA